MRFLRVPCLSSLAWLCAVAVVVQHHVPFASGAKAEDLYRYCVTIEDGRKLRCDLRFSEPARRPIVNGVTVKWPDGSDTAKFSPYDANRDEVAFLILVESSEPMSDKKVVSAIKADLKKIIAQARPTHRIGIAKFSDKLTVLAPIGSSKATLESTVEKLKLDGQEDEKIAFFQQTLAGIDQLSEFKTSGRRALVLMTSGASNEPEGEYFRTEAINRAKAQNVVIYGAAYISKDDPTDAQRVERLTTATFGPLVKADPKSRALETSFVENFFGYMEYGGTAVFPIRSGADGNLQKATLTADLGNRTASAEVVVASPARSWMQSIADWWSLLGTTYQIGVGVGALAVLGSIVGLIIWMRRGASSEREEFAPPITEGGPVPSPAFSPTMAGAPTMPGLGMTGADAGSMSMSNRATAILSPSGPAYAWLERVDTGERLPVSKTTVSIGRHEDNEVQIREESVHRRHANIHMTPQREFIVTDLSPSDGNRVKVNSTVIDKQRPLKDGDLLDFGKVRLKFVIATV